MNTWSNNGGKFEQQLNTGSYSRVLHFLDLNIIVAIAHNIYNFVYLYCNRISGRISGKKNPDIRPETRYQKRPENRLAGYPVQPYRTEFYYRYNSWYCLKGFNIRNYKYFIVQKNKCYFIAKTISRDKKYQNNFLLKTCKNQLKAHFWTYQAK